MSLDSFIYELIEENINALDSYNLKNFVKVMVTDDEKSVKEDMLREDVKEHLDCLTDTDRHDNDLFIQCLMNTIDWKWMCTQVFRHIDAIYGKCGICDYRGARNAEYLCKRCAKCPECGELRDLACNESREDVYRCSDGCDDVATTS